MKSGEYRFEYRTLPTANRDSRWLLSIGRLIGASGPDPYLVGMHLDITIQKQSAEALIRTEKLAVAGRLATTIAHEINNPVDVIQNLLFLLRGSQLSAEQHALCATMADELRRVADIATHTLRFQRQAAHATATHTEDLMNSALHLFEGKLSQASITTVSRFRANRKICGFEGELRQVLANLIGNAIDAMGTWNEPHPPFRLRLHTREGVGATSGEAGVFLTVADNGPGIPPDVINRIFDPFFTTKGEIGTGLGLWISSEIITKHRGELRVRSTQHPIHHGTVFRLFLPFEMPPPPITPR